jgi:formylmethanofuran:tetrahydromethanopterin formyltransferase
LGIGLTSASAKLEVSSSVNETPFIVSTPSSSLKINKEGILEISEYSGVATPVDGGLIYSASQFFVGI